jgi:hypothetical protein
MTRYITSDKGRKMATTPSTLSIKQLSAAVGSAVNTALDRHKLKATNQFIINPGTLAGPLLDKATDLKVAQQIADEVTKHVQESHATQGLAAAQPLQSGVLVTKRFILCGFFPYEVPQINVEHF